LYDFLSSKAEEFYLVKSSGIGSHGTINVTHAVSSQKLKGETMPGLGMPTASTGWRFAQAQRIQSRGDILQADPQPPHLSPAVRSALLYMTRHYSRPITLKDVSKVTAQTPSQMIRAFRKELGTTPHAWLIRLRVERGTYLLESGEAIASLASEVGFVDQTHFTRHFKRVHGDTPARYLLAARRAQRAEAA
jgi:transcriptional regulator GlxA family with amidase domain